MNPSLVASGDIAHHSLAAWQRTLHHYERGQRRAIAAALAKDEAADRARTRERATWPTLAARARDRDVKPGDDDAA